MLAVSVPNFVIGVVLILIFSLSLQMLPIAMTTASDVLVFLALSIGRITGSTGSCRPYR